MELDTGDGLSMIEGRTIIGGRVDADGLHIELDDGNIFVIIGTFYAGVVVYQGTIQ